MSHPHEDMHDAAPHHLTPDSPSPAPTPTPEPNGAKDARQYRPLPPTRASYSKPRTGASTPRQPVKTAKSQTVPAAAEEEIVSSPRTPRTLMVRPVEAKRLVPAYEEVDEIEDTREPVRATSVRTATNSRIPANPLRSR